MKSMILLVALAAAFPAAAQKPDMKGGETMVSEPGKAGMARGMELSALVVSIDKKTRTLSLKAPNGQVREFAVSDEVKNFEQIKAGDMVVVKVMQSLMLELQKVKTGKTGITATEGAVKAEPGQKPGVAAAREITAIAKVTKVDPKAKTIDLKGPGGNTVTLDVKNPEHFKVVKVGDEVLVTYTEAVAVSVEPAKKSDAKKDAGKPAAKPAIKG